MIKPIVAAVFLLLCAIKATSQNNAAPADSNEVNNILDRAKNLSYSSDSVEIIYLQAKLAAEKIGFIKGTQAANNGLADNYFQRGKFSVALKYLMNNEESAITQGDSMLLFNILRLQATIFGRIGDVNMLRKTVMRRQAILDNKGIKDFKDTSYAVLSQYNSLAQYYETKQVKKTDSMVYYFSMINRLGKGTSMENLWVQLSNGGLGRYYLNDKKQFDSAIYHLHIALREAIKGKRLDNQYGFTVSLADAFRQSGNLDSTFFYAYNAFNGATNNLFLGTLASSCGLLGKAYRDKKQYDSAVKYITLERDYRDSVSGMETLNNIQFLTTDQQIKSLEKQREKEAAINAYKSSLKNYFFAGGVLLLLTVIAVMFRINQQRARSKKQIERAYQDLKSTQSQLIQSEKMASLGELTAGIAHEIQNPLNFVNNFSEVSTELIDEMNEELDKGDIKEAKTISIDIKQNLEKINHHGKRADAIVKGMLQHSSRGNGKKEPTDINKLADEYLRLSYHGLRAKDKSFNATLKTDFDETIGNIHIIPQDIGRVLLNLITNAFYAVNEKNMIQQAQQYYEPTVSISTKKTGDKITIQVTDNGNGIAQNIVDKIFQPFFTTKPTGQGTGLGLSLAYDIVKAHGGELKVETKVDEGNPDSFGKGEDLSAEALAQAGTTFIIQLPVNN